MGKPPSTQPTARLGPPLLFLMFGAWAMGFAWAESFRWVDEKGMVHYSDRVPPEDAKHERARLNEQGRRVEQIEGAKSQEQLARERRLDQLRREQQRLLAEQHDRDLALLRSYRSEEELRQSHQNKLTTLDAIIKVTQSNRQRQADFLVALQKKAADLELKGQPVPKNLRDNIEATRRQIVSHQEKLDALEKDREAIDNLYQRDRDRFQLLQAHRAELDRFHIWREPVNFKGKEVAVSAVTCQPGADCERVWHRTRDYIQTHSALPLFTDTAHILQTASPQTDADIALIAVRIDGKIEHTVFLDLRCRQSSLGEELCSGPKGLAILAGFRQAIEGDAQP